MNVEYLYSLTILFFLTAVVFLAASYMWRLLKGKYIKTEPIFSPKESELLTNHSPRDLGARTAKFDMHLGSDTEGCEQKKDGKSFNIIVGTDEHKSFEYISTLHIVGTAYHRNINDDYFIIDQRECEIGDIDFSTDPNNNNEYIGIFKNKLAQQDIPVYVDFRRVLEGMECKIKSNSLIKINDYVFMIRI